VIVCYKSIFMAAFVIKYTLDQSVFCLLSFHTHYQGSG
jgi:hypothetical protein